MREELDMLRTHKADRVDLKRLEHRLSSQINETAISAGAGASQRPLLTNEGESEERFAGKQGSDPRLERYFRRCLR